MQPLQTFVRGPKAPDLKTENTKPPKPGTAMSGFWLLRLPSLDVIAHVGCTELTCPNRP